MKKKNNVYGIIGIGVKNANYNAGFDKYPKRTAEGELYATPQCLEYMIRTQLEKEGELILYRKSYNEDGSVRDLKSRYENLFDTKDDKKKSVETKSNVFKALDVRLFGAVYTGASTFGVTGAVQIGFGINKYENTNIESETILSPFASAEGKNSNTLGTQIFTDKAHYLHSFTFNANAYNNINIENFEGVTEEDFNSFKNASLIAVSNCNSKAKTGCQNEFAMFVETVDDINTLNLNGLGDYVTVSDNENNPNIINYNLENIFEILNSLKEKIKSVEIYYNPYTLNLNGVDDNFKSCTIYNILTREVIE